jgi:hypothetical protein
VKFLSLSLIFTFLLGACSIKSEEPGLISSQELGTVRGMHFSRIITHFHTPYSFDACDSKGLDSDNQPVGWCVADIKQAFCDNHIDFIFVSDHVSHVSSTSIHDLLLLGPQDTVVNNTAGEPVANAIYCDNGQVPMMMPGIEGRLLALGLQHHAPGSVDDLTNLYGGEDATSEAAIAAQTGALMAVPHTESRDISLLQSLNPAAIEIYNVHANLDPKIRKQYLNLPPFEYIAKFLNYLVDPTKTLNADYIFMDFFQQSPVYFQLWNTLLAGGMHVTGMAGLDSHQNIFPEKASDGLRLDSHRRMTRFMNNFVLTTGTDIDSIKAAIVASKLYFVLEGLGTPIGLDYYGLADGVTTEMGSTMTTTTATTSSLVFNIPVVYPKFPGMDSIEKPEIWAELHLIDSTGAETVVATSKTAQLTYPNPVSGTYRVHTFMIPHHLRQFIFDKSEADAPMQWIITNPIVVVK